MTIKHLVLSGGGPSIMNTLGVLFCLETSHYFKLEDLVSIYGTSSGAIMGVFMALKFDWETINDYVLKRPWQDVFPIKVENILDSYSKKGVFGCEHITKIFKPLFDAKDIPLDINLYDFYVLTKVELHFFSFEINEYKITDISYLSHPDISVITAVHMSCAVPLLFSPVFLEDKCYLDGGMICNYPLNFCIEQGKTSDEILGIKNVFMCDKGSSIIAPDFTILQFLMTFIHKAIFSLNIDNTQPHIENEVVCEVSPLHMNGFKDTVTKYDTRKELFDKGILFAKQFFDKINFHYEDDAKDVEYAKDPQDPKDEQDEEDAEDTKESLPTLHDSIQELN